jgi:2-hydroxycyclohexanecarboxyl-CoA dehydrogenase
MFFTQTTLELWERIIRINYMGVLNCTHTALGLMISQQSGAIVSISSDASRQGEAKEAVYGGVKAAIKRFMKTIAKENGRYGIRCNVVCSGLGNKSEC